MFSGGWGGGGGGVYKLRLVELLHITAPFLKFRISVVHALSRYVQSGKVACNGHGK